MFQRLIPFALMIPSPEVEIDKQRAEGSDEKDYRKTQKGLPWSEV
jgi:hypothetical protein